MITEKEKLNLIKKVDLMIADKDIKSINNTLKEIEGNINEYPLNFIKLILGYTGCYQRELKEWNKLYDAYKNISE